MLKKLSGYTLALIGLTAFFTSSCKKEYASINNVDSTAITTYIKQNNLTSSMVEDSAKTGFYYQIITPGTGKTFANSDSVLYNYSIKGLDNGVVYQPERPNGNYGTFVGYTYNVTYVSSSVANLVVISAVREVMEKLKPGGSARILIPSYLAFGKNGLGGIPANENIDMTVTVYPETVQWQLDDRLIREFIAAKGLTMIKDPSRIYYSIANVGSGTYPITDNSGIYCNYTLRLRDGLVLDTETDFFGTLGSGGLIAGWTLILPGKLQKGGQMRFIVPSDLAYGTTTTTGGLQGNTILDYSITITSVTQ